MKHLILLALFIMLHQYDGGLIYIKEGHIERIYRSFEGSQIIMKSCGDLFVEEKPEEILEMIRSSHWREDD